MVVFLSISKLVYLANLQWKDFFHIMSHMMNNWILPLAQITKKTMTGSSWKTRARHDF